jgi:hypothetical protein
MLLAAFEPAIPASERTQTVLDRAATGIGLYDNLSVLKNVWFILFCFIIFHIICGFICIYQARKTPLDKSVWEKLA